MRHYVTGLLSERYVVEAVRDGEAALRAARAQRPDLILSDVMMPGLDGFALLRALREEESLKTIPVILLSARAGEESRIEGLDKGADDYLIKPFGARELLARVQTHLEMARVRRETHKVLEESEARFREMADHAPVMIWVSDPSGTCTFLSKSWYEFTAQTPETGLGAGWLDAVHPEDRPRVRGQFQQASDRRTTLQLDYRIRRYDGEYRWAIDYAAPRFDRSGKFLGYIGSVIDITDRKRTEEALRESEARFAGFMRHLPGLAWIKDSEGRYLFVNEAASNVFPAIQGGVYGMTDFELFPPRQPSSFETMTCARSARPRGHGSWKRCVTETVCTTPWSPSFPSLPSEAPWSEAWPSTSRTKSVRRWRRPRPPQNLGRSSISPPCLPES